MIRKVFPILLCLMLVLTACGGEKTNATDNTQSTQEPVKTEVSEPVKEEPEPVFKLKLADQTGTTEILRGTTKPKLKADDLIEINDCIITGEDGIVTLQLGEAGYIVLSESTEVAIQGDIKNLIVYAKKGTITSILNNGIEDLESYMVDTGNAQTYATGTVFTVTAIEEGSKHTTTISMFDGTTKITLGSDNDNPVSLSVNKVLAVTNSADEISSEEKDIDLTSYSQPLLEIMSKLSTKSVDWAAEAQAILTARANETAQAEAAAKAEAEQKAKEEAARKQNQQNNSQQTPSNQDQNSQNQNNTPPAPQPTPAPQPQPQTATPRQNAEMALADFSARGWSNNGISIVEESADRLGWNTTLRKGDLYVAVGVFSYPNLTSYGVTYWQMSRNYSEFIAEGAGANTLLEALSQY